MKEVNGYHVLFVLLGFFLTTISVNAFFIWRAVDTFPGEVAPKAYLQGLHYNDVLAEKEAQEALGWKVVSSYEYGQNKDLQVVLTFTGPNGEALSGLGVEGELGRAAISEFDQKIAFKAVGQGKYEANVSGLEPGAWRLLFTAERMSSTPFKGEQRLWLE